MRFKILYILFFITALLYNSFRLFGEITPRNVMTVIMFLACVIEDRRVLVDKWIGFYFLFLLFFALSSMITGYLQPFLHRLIGYFFVGWVGYGATKILVKKYDAVRLLIYLILIIGMLDSVVTMGQFFNLPYFTVIPQILGIGVDTELLESLNVGDEAFGIVLPGIMGNDVYNGYFLMVVGVLSLYYLRFGFKIIGLMPWLMAVVASFMVQQRAPFYLLLVISVVVFFKAILLGKSRIKWMFVLALLIVVPVGFNYLFDLLITGNTRYNIGLETTGRDEIYQQSMDFISNNMLFGGFFKSGLAPHNMFLTAWIAGGVFGFIAITIMTIMQITAVIRLLIKKIDNEEFVCLLFGLAFVGFTMNSMFHNAGMTSGDVVIWTLWAAFLGCRDSINKQREFSETVLT